MGRRMDDCSLLDALRPVAEDLFERHDRAAKEWFPHHFVPYGRGRDFDRATPWSESDADVGDGPVGDAVRSALIVNLLTEDNLPYYFRSIEQLFGAAEIWGTWARRWTAEEGRHAMAIYGYLMTTRAVDPVALERARMVQVSNGVTPRVGDVADGFIYVAMQELATRIAHRNTGALLSDPAGADVMRRVAADENLHHLFYRDLATAAFELDPSAMVKALHRQVTTFEMPGSGIPEFARHARAIAQAGIYDLVLHHEQILVPLVLRHWKVEHLRGLDAEAEAARDRLMTRMARSARAARRVSERRLTAERPATTAVGWFTADPATNSKTFVAADGEVTLRAAPPEPAWT
jgi:acyl-[acyl-carrier protein] desaturase